MDTLGEEWKVLGEVLRALRAHDGRIEDEISHLLQIYVPPEDEVPVRQPLVVRDGAVTRMSVWTGPRGHAEDALERADVPAWRDASAPGAAPVTEYLTEELRLRAARTACARTQVTWLRDRLLKLGAHVLVSVRHTVLHLPRSTPDRAAWQRIALALGARAG